jgi:hypothetical protein
MTKDRFSRIVFMAAGIYGNRGSCLVAEEMAR